MFGAIIGDIVGSRFEFFYHKSKDFELLEQEAVRVVKLFKGLQPGIKNGNIVRTKHLIPVTFKLN